MPLPPAYTIEIASFTIIGFGVQDSPVCPAGFRWVLTDIDVSCDGTGGLQWEGFTVQDDANVKFFARTYPQTRKLQSQHWRGRQVIDAGHYFSCLHFDSTARLQLRATGFQLTLV